MPRFSMSTRFLWNSPTMVVSGPRSQISRFASWIAGLKRRLRPTMQRAPVRSEISRRGARLRHVQSGGLLQQGVDAGLQADLGNGSVELGGHRDDHGVRGLGFEHPLRRRIGGNAAKLLGRGVAACFVQVAHRRHHGSVDRGDVACVAPPPSAAADQGCACLFHAPRSSAPATSMITLRSWRSPRASAVITSGTSSSVQRASMKVASRPASCGSASTLAWNDARSKP